MRQIVVAILFVCFAGVFGVKARFNDYRVFSVSIETEKQLNVLRELETHPNGILFRGMPTTVRQNVDIIVPPHKLFDIYKIFSAHEFNSQTKTEDLQKSAKKHTIYWMNELFYS